MLRAPLSSLEVQMPDARLELDCFNATGALLLNDGVRGRLKPTLTHHQHLA